MYLTRIKPNMSWSPHIRNEVFTASALVRRLMKMFPDDLGPEHRFEAGLLSRVDWTTAGPVIVAQSVMEPDPTQLPSGYDDAKVHNMTAHFEQISTGQRYEYRIVANTVTRHGSKTVRVVTDVEELRDWWLDRSTRNGATPDTTDIKPLAPSKETRMMVTRTQFSGVLTVTDAENLRYAVQDGIGRAKTYGCGLLSLKPVIESW